MHALIICAAENFADIQNKNSRMIAVGTVFSKVTISILYPRNLHRYISNVYPLCIHFISKKYPGTIHGYISKVYPKCIHFVSTVYPKNIPKISRNYPRIYPMDISNMYPFCIQFLSRYYPWIHKSGKSCIHGYYPVYPWIIFG